VGRFNVGEYKIMKYFATLHLAEIWSFSINKLFLTMRNLVLADMAIRNVYRLLYNKISLCLNGLDA
jgi:hypothetical protein